MLRIYIINFLLAISTTIGMTVLPFMITDALGLSLLVLGIIEGSTEFLSNFFRLLNGILFDKIKNKRLIFVISIALAFISKAILLLFNPWAILASKTLERMSNGTFASPRDAFVAANAVNKGSALALLNVSKALGCILGPLTVSAFTLYLGGLKDNLQFFITLCCLLVFPAFLMSFSLEVKKINETPFSASEIGKVAKQISPILIIGLLFFMGRFNDGLIMIYLRENGYPEWFYLSSIAIFNSIMLISSPIIGRLLDKRYLSIALYIAIGSLVLFNLLFYQIQSISWPLAIIGLFAWGIQRSSTQIVFSSIVFRLSDKANYGTAIGLFYIITGITSFCSSSLCGHFARFNFKFIFILSGLFASFALMAVTILLNKITRPVEVTSANPELGSSSLLTR